MLLSLAFEKHPGDESSVYDRWAHEATESTTMFSACWGPDQGLDISSCNVTSSFSVRSHHLALRAQDARDDQNPRTPGNGASTDVTSKGATKSTRKVLTWRHTGEHTQVPLPWASYRGMGERWGVGRDSSSRWADQCMTNILNKASLGHSFCLAYIFFLNAVNRVS